MRRTRLTIVAILTALPAWPETAVLECIGDTVTRGRDRGKIIEVQRSGHLFLDFRFSAIEGWQLRGTRLMLHLVEGSFPALLQVSPILTKWKESAAPPRSKLGIARPVRVETHQENWISLDIPPALLQPTLLGAAFGIAVHNTGGQPLLVHARESLS